MNGLVKQTAGTRLSMSSSMPENQSSAAGAAVGGWERATIFIVAAFLLLRVIYLGFPDLFPEEAYYWNYAKHLDIGYLDHPPMVAWLIHLGTAAFGDSEFGIRVCALLTSLIAGVFIFRL